MCSRSFHPNMQRSHAGGPGFEERLREAQFFPFHQR
jgi:hypothetical protein